MPEEKPSVLQQIRKREVELSVRADQARIDAEQIVVDAKREAADILKSADADGRRIAEEYHQEKLGSVLKEVDSIRSSGKEEVRTVRLRGEQNLPKAVDTILSVVISE